MKARIATVKATGKRYMVLRLSVDLQTVVAYGEVTEIRGARVLRTEAHHQLPRAAVELTEVELTPAFTASLFNQAIASRREAGNDVRVTRAGNARDYGKRA